MSKKINLEEKSKAAFSWGAISGAVQKGLRPKGAWEDRFTNLSDSSTSSDVDGEVRVSARQRKLLSSSRELSGRSDSVKTCHSSAGSSLADRDWLRSARQRELIRTGSGSDLRELKDKHSKSLLKQEWQSTSSQRFRHVPEHHRHSKWTAASAGSRDLLTKEPHRDSAGSLGRSGSGSDLLVEAVRFGRTRHIKLLLDGGTDPNALDHEGVSPLIAAAADIKDAKLQKRLMNLLLEAGADPNFGDCEGSTPLMHATNANRHDAAMILLQNNKTDPSIKNDAGFSALMYAASNGYSNIVLLILAAFKKIHHVTHLGEKNCKGLTAIDLAEKNGHFDVAALLRVDHQPFATSRVGRRAGFVPDTHQLSRSPTPSDESLILSDESDSLGFNPLNDQTFRPPTPVSDLEEFTSLSLVDNKDQLLDIINNIEADSSLGSGNEADTESLMDEDRVSLNEVDTEAPMKMSSPLVRRSHPAIMVSDPSSSPRSTVSRTPKRSMKIIMDRDAMEKLKDMVGPTANFPRGGDHQAAASTSQTQSLNPLKKVVVPTQGNLTTAENMPRIELTASVRSLNKSIKSLIQEDQELKPSNRPPTPARPSLPNLLSVRQDSDSDSPISSSSNEVSTRSRRLTLAGFPRSSSDNHQASHSISSPKSFHDEDDTPQHILESSTKSEGWDSLWGSRSRGLLSNTDGHVVPLPPIGQSRQSLFISKSKKPGKQTDNLLSVAKKTFERLDNVLGADDASKRKSKSQAKSRTIQHLNLSS